MLLNIVQIISGQFHRSFIGAERLSLLEQGILISIIGIGVVFLGLITLFFCMKLFIFVSNYSRKRAEKATGTMIVTDKSGQSPVSREIAAAISLAIHQSREEFHDLEKTILTLNRITRPYSPWSSKIHVLRRPAR